MLTPAAADKQAVLRKAFADMRALRDRQIAERREAYQNLVRALAAKLTLDTSGEPEC